MKIEQIMLCLILRCYVKHAIRTTTVKEMKLENSLNMYKGIVHACGKSQEAVLAYGMGASKLAATIEVTMKEAKQLIEDYFKAFPSIGSFLSGQGNFGVVMGYVSTFAPFKRRRQFPGWRPGLRYVEEAQELLSTIERASKNTPIQGTSADMTKLALVKVRNYINKHNLPVKLVMTVHDQIDTIVRDDYAETWKGELTKLMEEAAAVIIPNGLLKADTNISSCWEK